jgi:nitrite reductase/ring-hydroxylating ferredoxin subunit
MKHINQSEELEGFVKLCSLESLIDSEGKRFIVDDNDIAVFKIGEKVFAVNNVCPHQRSALIYDGFVEDDFVVCPAHGWKFNLATGKTPSGSGGLLSHEVKIFENNVYVKIKEQQWF